MKLDASDDRQRIGRVVLLMKLHLVSSEHNLGTVWRGEGARRRVVDAISQRFDMLVCVTATVPPYTDMLWPTLRAAIACGAL